LLQQSGDLTNKASARTQSDTASWRVRWIILCILGLALGPTPARAERDLALVGATIYPAPGAPVISNGIVIVRDGVIAAVGSRADGPVSEKADVLDCSGFSLTSAFWNSHVHFMPWRLFVAGWLPSFVSAGEIQAMLTRYGFVHVLDTGSLLGSTLRLRTRTAQGRLAGPVIHIAAGSFVAPGGSPFYLWPFRLPELKTPAEAREQVLRTLDAGADGIKLFTGGLAAPDSVIVMDTEVVRAATTAAHERGAFVVSHPSNSSGARAAIEGGVDILAHTFPMERDGPWDRSLLPRMKRAGMALIPTIKLWEYELQRAGQDRAMIERWIQVAQDQVRSFATLGGPILFGTDVGYMREYDPTAEYVYLAGAGLSFDQILATLTTAPAERFKGASRTGRIAAGMDADLVVFDGDPRADIRSLAQVRHVLHRGRIVYRDDARSCQAANRPG
jgi:imidazolonepropionase-like amidohydrolase